MKKPEDGVVLVVVGAAADARVAERAAGAQGTHSRWQATSTGEGGALLQGLWRLLLLRTPQRRCC